MTNFSGIDTLVNILENPEKYKKALKELQNETKRFEAILVEVGLLGKVEAAKQSAEAANAAANKLLEDTQARVKKLEETAAKNVKEREEILNKREDRLFSLQGSLEELHLKLKIREEEVNKKEKEVKAKQEDLFLLEKEFKKNQAEVTERLAKLKQVMGEQ